MCKSEKNNGGICQWCLGCEKINEDRKYLPYNVYEADLKNGEWFFGVDENKSKLIRKNEKKTIEDVLNRSLLRCYDNIKTPLSIKAPSKEEPFENIPDIEPRYTCNGTKVKGKFLKPSTYDKMIEQDEEIKEALKTSPTYTEKTRKVEDETQSEIETRN